MIGKQFCQRHLCKKGLQFVNKLRVVVSLLTEDNDYQLEQAAAAQAAALTLGANLEIVFAGNDAVKQTQQLLSFIQEPDRRPDAILVEPVGTSMPQIAKAAVDGGIGWSLINVHADYIPQLRMRAAVPVFSVLCDHEEIGKIQGQQIGAILGDRGCVLHIEGPGLRDIAKLRTKGMLSTKPAAVDVKTLRGDWTQRSGYQAIKSWLSLSTSRQLHVGMIACQNDDMAIGARKAFEELGDIEDRGHWLRQPITGCDGVPKAGQAWVRQGHLAATVISPPLAGTAMQLMASALKTGAQPPEHTVSAPSSFPELKELQKTRGHGQGM